jgi:hypothetical protein
METITGTPATQVLIKQLAKRPEFMAYVLNRYLEQEKLSPEELAEELGTSPELALRLWLCKRPDPKSHDFRLLVQELADYCLADEVALAKVLRQVAWLEQIGSPSSSQAFLAAARDREDLDPYGPPLSDDGKEDCK